jgi:hypothetical protein
MQGLRTKHLPAQQQLEAAVDEGSLGEKHRLAVPSLREVSTSRLRMEQSYGSEPLRRGGSGSHVQDVRGTIVGGRNVGRELDHARLWAAVLALASVHLHHIHVLKTVAVHVQDFNVGGGVVELIDVVGTDKVKIGASAGAAKDLQVRWSCDRSNGRDRHDYEVEDSITRYVRESSAVPVQQVWKIGWKADPVERVACALAGEQCPSRGVAYNEVFPAVSRKVSRHCAERGKQTRRPGARDFHKVRVRAELRIHVAEHPVLVGLIVRARRAFRPHEDVLALTLQISEGHGNPIPHGGVLLQSRVGLAHKVASLVLVADPGDGSVKIGYEQLVVSLSPALERPYVADDVVEAVLVHVHRHAVVPIPRERHDCGVGKHPSSVHQALGPLVVLLVPRDPVGGGEIRAPLRPRWKSKQGR